MSGADAAAPEEAVAERASRLLLLADTEPLRSVARRASDLLLLGPTVVAESADGESSALATAVVSKRDAPMPRAIASAPTRPTYLDMQNPQVEIHRPN
jgi:hypothetical protein